MAKTTEKRGKSKMSDKQNRLQEFLDFTELYHAFEDNLRFNTVDRNKPVNRDTNFYSPTMSTCYICDIDLTKKHNTKHYVASGLSLTEPKELMAWTLCKSCFSEVQQILDSQEENSSLLGIKCCSRCEYKTVLYEREEDEVLPSLYCNQSSFSVRRIDNPLIKPDWCPLENLEKIRDEIEEEGGFAESVVVTGLSESEIKLKIKQSGMQTTYDYPQCWICRRKDEEEHCTLLFWESKKSAAPNPDKVVTNYVTFNTNSIEDKPMLVQVPICSTCLTLIQVISKDFFKGIYESDKGMD